MSAFLAIRSLHRSKQARLAYQILRQSFGGAILLGLEVLVAADLVRTVAVAPTIENVAILGLIVLIRTVLSFSLEVEIEGGALAAGRDERSQLRCSCRQTQRRNKLRPVALQAHARTRCSRPTARGLQVGNQEPAHSMRHQAVQRIVMARRCPVAAPVPGIQMSSGQVGDQESHEPASWNALLFPAAPYKAQ